MFSLMLAKDRFGAAPLCSAVLSAFPPLCASVSPPLHLPGGVPFRDRSLQTPNTGLKVFWGQHVQSRRA